MYSEHKWTILFISFVTGILTVVFELQYSEIASDVISVISIASAIYLAAYAGIQASPKLLQELKKPDKKKKGKSQLFVINAYIKCALGLGLITIAVSSLSILLAAHDSQIGWSIIQRFWDYINETIVTKEFRFPSWEALRSSFVLFVSIVGMMLFSANLSFMWVIGLFIVNRMAFNK